MASNIEGALFETLRYLPAFGVLPTVANILIISFFVTSADSATYVISSFSTHGSGATGKRLVIFWGCALGGMAAVLLRAGGPKALQTASIIGSFPFIAIMWLLLASTVKELVQEHRQRAKSAVPGVVASGDAKEKA